MHPLAYSSSDQMFSKMRLRHPRTCFTSEPVSDLSPSSAQPIFDSQTSSTTARIDSTPEREMLAPPSFSINCAPRHPEPLNGKRKEAFG